MSLHKEELRNISNTVIFWVWIRLLEMDRKTVVPLLYHFSFNNKT